MGAGSSNQAIAVGQVGGCGGLEQDVGPGDREK